MGHQYRIDLWLCAFILGGFSKASHIPLMPYLPYAANICTANI